MSSRKGRAWGRGLALSAAVGLALVLTGACGSDEAEELRRAQLAEGCLLNTDCKSPLVCAFRKCHVQCVEQRDCPDGELCVPTDKPFNVCMFESEQKCSYHSQCPLDFRCVASKCRPECKTEKDCVPDQKCAEGSCAVPAEVNANGGLITQEDASSLGNPCVYNSDCPNPLYCIAGTCLAQCKTSKDCPGSTCSDAGTCSPPDGGTSAGPGACANGVKDATESAVDCGGTCGACAGAACTKPSDCASHVCKSQVCAAPSCTDALQNGTESDIDCGGTSCPKCAAPKGCWTASDCAEGKCTAFACTTPGCTDGTQSGSETDIDCGGGQCAACGNGKGCAANGDCSSANCVAKLCKAAGPSTWVEAMTGTPRVAADPSGNLVAAGTFVAGQSIGGVALSSAGGNDLFAAKLTPAGATLWVVSLGGTGDDQLEEVVVDSKSDVIVAGNTTNGASFKPPLTCALQGMFALKLGASDGKQLWSRCISVPSSNADGDLFSVGVDAADNVYLGGRFYGTLDFGSKQFVAGNFRGYVAKYAADSGLMLWAKDLPTGTSSTGAGPRALIGDGSNVIAVGDFSQTLDLGGKQLVSTLSSTTDVYVARFAGADGAVQEARRIGDAGAEVGRDIARDASAGLVVTGSFASTQVDFGSGQILNNAGNTDAFLVKLDAATFATTWAKGFGGAGYEYGVSVATTGAGEIALAAEIGGAVNFGVTPVQWVGAADLVLARFNAAGGHLYSKSWGHLSTDTPTSVVWVGTAVGFAGKYSGGTLDFGTGPLPATKTAFFAHLVP